MTSMLLPLTLLVTTVQLAPRLGETRLEHGMIVTRGGARLRVLSEPSPPGPAFASGMASGTAPSSVGAGACLSPLAWPGQPVHGGGAALDTRAYYGGIGLNGRGETVIVSGVSGSFRNQGLFRVSAAGPVPLVMGCGAGGGSGDPGSFCGDATPIGGTFGGFFSTFKPAVNAQGDALFMADVYGGSAPRGLFVHEAAGTIVKVVAVGDPAPGGGTFTSLGLGSLNAAGDVAFLARTSLSPPGPYGVGVFLRRGGSLSALAFPGQPAPGGGSFELLGGLALVFGGDGTTVDVLPAPDVDDDGRVALRAYVQGGPVYGGMLVVEPDGQRAWAMTLGEPAPGGGEFADILFSAPVLANGGLMAFFAETYDPVAGVGDSGWFVGRSGAWRSALRGSDSVGGREIVSLAVSHNPAQPLASDGRLAVLVGLEDPSDPVAGQEHIAIAASDGTLELVAAEGQPTPFGGQLGAPDAWPNLDAWGRANVSASIFSGGVPDAHLLAGPCVTVSVADAATPEGNAGSHRAAFPVTLSAASDRTVTVAYATAPDSAGAASDYYDVAGTLSFAPGETSGTIEVPVLGDWVQEPDEQFRLRLLSGQNASPGDIEAAGTIQDDDVAGLSVADLRVVERRSDTVSASFEVTLAPPVAVPVEVTFATEDGSAISPGDYGPAAGTLVIPAGASQGVVEVKVEADDEREGPETFSLRLLSATGAAIARAQATATILAPQDGDFGGDGHVDLLLRHATNGALELWSMDGADRVAAGPTSPGAVPDTQWLIASTPDLNGDGSADVLWRNATSGQNVAWLMEGPRRVASVPLTPDTLADTNWRMAGTGHLNADAHADIVLQHGLSGAIVVWLMNGTTRVAGVYTTPASLPPSTGWRIAGVGDLDGDGQGDLVWHNSISGRCVVWLMDGTVRRVGAFTSPDSAGSADWFITAVGDFDADGRADLLWRQGLTGELLLWYMDGVTRREAVPLLPGALADPAWKIVGPR